MGWKWGGERFRLQRVTDTKGPSPLDGKHNLTSRQGSSHFHDSCKKNLVDGVGLQLTEVTQVPVVHCGGNLGPHLPTYHIICEGDVQRIRTPLHARMREQEKREGKESVKHGRLQHVESNKTFFKKTCHNK